MTSHRPRDPFDTLADRGGAVGQQQLESLRSENRTLRMELDDHVGRLELLKTDNDNLIQRLGDARKDRDRIEQDMERERRDFKDRIQQLEKSRSDNLV